MGYRLSGDSRSTQGSAFEKSTVSADDLGTPFKRIFDIAGSLGLLIVVTPVILAFALAMKLQDGGDCFYWAPRRGLKFRQFNCFKIRSMVPDAGERLKDFLSNNAEAQKEWDETHKLRDDPRVTKLGLLVRKTSIDELPQLFNVLRGDMSLVGPRPITIGEETKYGENLAVYATIRPGLTGLWQIKGRGVCTYAERVQLDVEYVNTRTFWGDVGILLKTLPALMNGKAS